MIRFCTFGDEKYAKSCKRICNEAKSLSFIDTATAYTPDMISSRITEVPSLNSLFKHKIGYGYWIWKADIMLSEFQQMKDGDILIYLDAGCIINIFASTAWKHYFDLLSNQTAETATAVPWIVFQMGFKEWQWTKASTFEIFQKKFADVSEETWSQIKQSGQCAGGMHILKKTPRTTNILFEFLEIVQHNPMIIQTDPHEPQDPQFKQHRHDQSIWSLLAKLYNFIILPDVTYERIIKLMYYQPNKSLYWRFLRLKCSVPFFAARIRE